ncbi:spindle pole body component 110-like [Dorcoceras hygrometricum]|uniref:Spindle pole body component 110-like n=1 Tax=Dorcoceras hygrometricum TaxID=472368 RepID=A0A2Z7D365_9LAMI|nr:spindle pole body component 110-like [Dorcoceras hygrometricum]
MQAALSKLATENDELRSRYEDMLKENQRLDGIISSWTRSSASLNKLHGVMKSSGDKTGLGYDGNDSSTAETSCTAQLARKNFKNEFCKIQHGTAPRSTIC